MNRGKYDKQNIANKECLFNRCGFLFSKLIITLLKPHLVH